MVTFFVAILLTILPAHASAQGFAEFAERTQHLPTYKERAPPLKEWGPLLLGRDAVELRPFGYSLLPAAVSSTAGVSGTDSGFGTPWKVNLASVPSPSASMTMIWPGSTSP
ncbi:hypothetical protein NOGI109294_20135 [Nocardiopsis gilva]